MSISHITRKFFSVKRIVCIILSIVLLTFNFLFFNVSTKTMAASEFSFNGSMSKEVLRNYVSRAVTFQGFAVEDNTRDSIFEEDLRMIRNIGAKYIGRSAFYSWGGNMTAAQIENHFAIAKQQAAKAHAADPELILQAGVFEIAYEDTVNNTPIPAYVFKAFGQPVTSRNFSYSKIVFPRGTRDASGTDTGIGCWGNDVSGVPDITKLETKMYFYYQITRYIDAGYEAFHMGQAEKMMLYRGNSYASHWDELLTKARSYAKTHARRGIALFDCHTAFNSGGIKVGNRLIFDIQGAAAVPNETIRSNGAMMCELTSKNQSWLSWIGSSAGGIHPLGFNVENNFTIIEFDNYGGNGNPGVATHDAFYNWGMDDITWFATQPEWYRNLFLLESADYLKENFLDSRGKQQYFLQPCCRRVITPDAMYFPEIVYTPGKNYKQSFLKNYAQKENFSIEQSSSSKNILLVVKEFYRANKNSDACPNGFSQEDTIKKIFANVNSNKDFEYVIDGMPQGYGDDYTYVYNENGENSSAESFENTIGDSSENSSTEKETNSKDKLENKENSNKQFSTKKSKGQKFDFDSNFWLIIIGIAVGVIALIALVIFLFIKIM